MDIDQKYGNAKEIIKGLGRVLVAFSGGVDSTFLLKTCVDVLGRDNVLAFIGLSPTCPAREIDEAKNLSAFIGAEYVIRETSEMEDPDFVRNDKSRCYYCKTHLFRKAWEIAEKGGFLHVVEGSNLDDMDDYRPGRKACVEQKAISPLLIAELTKNEIRELSKTLGLPTHDKPAFACLSSRIPYGTPIGIDILNKIELSEDFIRSLGIRQVRVRYHGSVARIEVANNEIDTVIDNKEAIAEALRKYGFLYIALDLQGYRTGSMNSPVNRE
ncbi:MAG: ATP-dependent sacrificial sulfur transferase LarE [Deltaproteobacteria bacterium]